MKLLQITLMLSVLIAVYFGSLMLGMEKGVDDFKESEEFINNYVDMREVVDFEATDNGLHLYMEDGSGYYWGE